MYTAFGAVAEAMPVAFPLLSSGVLPSNHGAIFEIQLSFKIVEFLAAIDRAELRTAPELDGNIYELYKNIDVPVLTMLLEYVNQVLLSGQPPKSWLRTNTVPISKPGTPPHVLQNLRPIALTATPWKLLKVMLARGIQWWLDTFQPYQSSQIGFRPHLGAEKSLDFLSHALGGRPFSPCEDCTSYGHKHDI